MLAPISISHIGVVHAQVEDIYFHDYRPWRGRVGLRIDDAG